MHAALLRLSACPSVKNKWRSFVCCSSLNCTLNNTCKCAPAPLQLCCLYSTTNQRAPLSQGFPSKLRSNEAGLAAEASAAASRKQTELRRSLRDLGLAWALVLVCCTHHFGHLAHLLGWHSIAHGPIFTWTMQPLFQVGPEPGGECGLDH